MVHKSLAVGIVLLFIASTVTPAVISYSEPISRDNESDDEILSYSSVFQKQNNGLSDSPWPMACHDVRHTGRSNYSTQDNPLTEKWRIRTDNWADNSPCIGNDGTIYFGSSWDFYAVYPNGTLRWKFYTGGLLLGLTPAVANDGTIYIGSWSHNFYAFHPNGTLNWSYDANADISSCPAIAEDGTIYFGTLSLNGALIALDSNGQKKWSFSTGGRVYSDPAIGEDGTIYIGSDDYYFYAINPNGTLKWKYFIGGAVKGPPSIANDGTIYFGCWQDDYLYALYPDGTLRWQKDITYGSSRNPSIGSDGTIYISSRNYLYALYPNDGAINWVFDLGEDTFGFSTTISADGTIFIGTQIDSPGEGGDIIAVNPDGTERWRKRLADKWVKSIPAIDNDGTVYVCSSSGMPGMPDPYGYLHAFNAANLSIDAGGPYYGIPDSPIQFDSTTFGGVPPYDYFWDFGDDEASTEEDPVHVYDESEEYYVTLTVTDSEMNDSVDTAYVNVNDPPNNPIISGETHGQYGQPYEYTFSAVDPQDEDVYFRINWGDTDYLDWFGPFESGEEVKINHTYQSRGTYNLICWARDIHEERSDPTTLEVTMPVNQQSPYPWFTWFLELFPNAFPILRHLLEAQC